MVGGVEGGAVDGGLDEVVEGELDAATTKKM